MVWESWGFSLERDCNARLVAWLDEYGSAAEYLIW